MIKLTEQREITPYVWVHPDDEFRLSRGFGPIDALWALHQASDERSLAVFNRRGLPDELSANGRNRRLGQLLSADLERGQRRGTRRHGVFDKDVYVAFN
jgi:hypothetical protein